jgi:hypothetical protein
MGIMPRRGLAAKDCNRLYDRAVTIRLTAMCHLTGFRVPEDYLCQEASCGLVRIRA